MNGIFKRIIIAGLLLLLLIGTLVTSSSFSSDSSKIPKSVIRKEEGAGIKFLKGEKDKEVDKKSKSIFDKVKDFFNKVFEKDDTFENKNNNNSSNTVTFKIADIPKFDNKTPYLFYENGKFIKPKKIDYSYYGKKDNNITDADLNNGTPNFSYEDVNRAKTSSWETYSDLDELGRCGVAYANICKEIMPTEDRGAIGSVKPSGWQTIKYNGVVEGNYLYNRCHLIAFSLAGENANEKNLITGTRYLNIQGMVRYENMVNAYVKRTGNHCLYRVTPIYDKDNLLASGLMLEGYSVEDNGAGINFCIYSYNEQPDIIINHENGDSKLRE